MENGSRENPSAGIRPSLNKSEASRIKTGSTLARVRQSLDVRNALPASDVDRGTHRPRRRQFSQEFIQLLGPAIVVVTFLLLTAPLARGAIALAPPYVAGCNGTATGAGVVSNTGATGHYLLGPNLVTGALSNYVDASSGGAYSAIQTKSYFFVGCYTPAANHVGVYANYTWNASYHPLLQTVCPGTTNAYASVNLTVAANIHEAAPPYYLAIPSPIHTVVVRLVHCVNWNPGTASTVFVVSVGPVNVARGVNYDFYSSLWNFVNATASGPGAGADAHDWVNATMTGVTCNCP
jgi:hypothetical protein